MMLLNTKIKVILEKIEEASRVAKETFLSKTNNTLLENDNIVLLIDDDAFIYNILSYSFDRNKANFKLLWVNNIEQAKIIINAASKASNIKCAICDMNLGLKVDPNDAIAELMKANIPTVIYTGYNFHEVERRLTPEHLKYTVYIQKKTEIDLNTLKNILENIVAGNITFVK